MDDLFLIKQALNGNPQAFRFIVLRYQRPLFKFLGGFNIETAIVEEIAQEVFLKACQNLTRYDPGKGATFATWLFTIAKRLAINELKRSDNKRQWVQLDSLDQLEDSGMSPLDALHAEQRQRLIRQAIGGLPDPFRNPIILSYIEELSLADIAAIEQCSVGTVKSRIFRGKKLLLSTLVTVCEVEQ